MSDDFLEAPEGQKPCEGFYVNCVDFSCEDFPCVDLYHGLKAFSQSKIDQDQYVNSDLANWLKLEEWNVREALLLLCDLSPDGAVINWGQMIKIDGSTSIDHIKINKAQILSCNDDWLVRTSVCCESSSKPQSLDTHS